MSTDNVQPKRFWALVEKTDTCWLWIGGRSKSGGRFGTGGYGKYGGRAAHRIAYEMIVGPIPDGLQLDHLCRVTRCVNPAHLEPVTQLENIRRHYERRTRCAQGHELTADNVYRRPGSRSGRGCRTCIREGVARYKARSQPSRRSA